MAANDPESRLASFLAAQPSWRRKWLEFDSAWTPAETAEWSQARFSEDRSIRAEYEAILREMPDKWREYRAKLKKLALQTALSSLPIRQGRPRKNAIALEAAALQKNGKSYAQIALLINSKHGPKTTTPEAIRKLLYSRRKQRQNPDKT